MKITTLLLLTVFSIVGVQARAAGIPLDAKSIACVAKDISVARLAVNTDGSGPILSSGSPAADGSVTVKSSRGSAKYFVSAVDGEVMISNGQIISAGAGQTRIMDVKKGVGLACRVLN